MPDLLIGKKIKAFRPMTDAEKKEEGWDDSWRSTPSVIVLEDNTKIYTSTDAEGNGPGEFFGVLPDGRSVMIVAKEST